jgi:hypothetical protein
MLLLIDGPDGLPPGATSLEPTDSPAIVGPTPLGVTPPAPVEPIEPPPAAPDGDDEPEGVVYDSRGQKLVPLQALQQTRAELKAAKALASQVEQMREAADRGQAMEGWVENLKPLLARLKNRPDIVAAVMSNQQAPPMGPQSPYQPAPDPGEALLPKQDAEDLARTLELYTPEGAPDLARARKLAFFMRRTAGQEAHQATAPLTQNLAMGQSGTLKGQYAQVKDKHGRTVNQAVLNQMWNIVPAELIANDPNVAGVLYYAAKGYSAHHGLEEPSQAPRSPLLSEPAGGRPQPTTTLTELDRAMQKAMQVSDKQYTDAGARYRPGAINVLE